jgi:hypothetical protein
MEREGVYFVEEITPDWSMQIWILSNEIYWRYRDETVDRSYRAPVAKPVTDPDQFLQVDHPYLLKAFQEY